MGCCKGKANRSNKEAIEAFDKESQEKRLNDLLHRIEMEIRIIKQGKSEMQINLQKKQRKDSKFIKANFDNSEELLQLRRRSVYLAQLLIFVKWTIKVRQVNQPDRRFDDIIDKIKTLVDNNDEFLISSLENKIRHILNKK